MPRRFVPLAALVALLVFAGLVVSACGGSGAPAPKRSQDAQTTATARSGTRTSPAAVDAAADARETVNVYRADAAGMFSPQVHGDPALVYVPNSMSNTVSVISQRTMKVIAQFPTGALPQHVTPSWDLKTLYVDNDLGNSLTPIDPRTGRPGRPIPVEDPYNLYFTPDGRFAIVVAERLQLLDFRRPGTMALVHSLSVPVCRGVDHMDFSAGGRYAYASCEFAGRMIEVDLRTQTLMRTLVLNHGDSSPQDVKLSPDGRTLYTADQINGGVWEIDPATFRVLGFLHTGAGAHGLYPSRDARVHVRLQPPGGLGLGGELPDPAGRQDLAAPAAGQPRHGRRISGREHAVAERPLQRGRLRHRYAHRPSARHDPGRLGAPRPVRLAPARALLAGAHGHHALSPRQARNRVVRSGPAGGSALTSGDYAAAGASVAEPREPEPRGRKPPRSSRSPAPRRWTRHPR